MTCSHFIHNNIPNPYGGESVDELTRCVVREVLQLRTKERNEARCKSCWDIGFVLAKVEKGSPISPAVYARNCPECSNKGVTHGS